MVWKIKMAVNCPWKSRFILENHLPIAATEEKNLTVSSRCSKNAVSGLTGICVYTVYRSGIIQIYDECVKAIIIKTIIVRIWIHDSCKIEHAQLFSSSSSSSSSSFHLLNIPFFRKLQSHPKSALRTLYSEKSIANIRLIWNPWTKLSFSEEKKQQQQQQQQQIQRKNNSSTKCVKNYDEDCVSAQWTTFDLMTLQKNHVSSSV